MIDADLTEAVAEYVASHEPPLTFWQALLLILGVKR